MIDALTATSSSMMNDMIRLNTISHNLANSATAGFKREILVSRPFTEHLAMAGSGGLLKALPVSLPSTESMTDFKPGTMKFSGNPLDMAIEDEGFFEVMTEHGPAYTRQGGFRLDVQGRLVTEAGLPVIGMSGELMLPTSQPVVRADGRIFDGEKEIGQMKLVKFADPETLQSIGSGLYLAGSDSITLDENSPRIRQGFTEASNVNSMAEMVKIIETMRHFESGQRLVQGYDAMMEKAIRTLGEF